ITGIRGFLVGAADKSAVLSGIQKHMRVLFIRDHSLPHIGAILAGHDEHPLAFPFRRKLSLLPDRDLPGLVFKCKMLSRRAETADRSPIPVVIAYSLQVM